MADKKSPGLLEIVETKIAGLIAEFREGDVSPERFNVIYGRYYQQLKLAYIAAREDKKGTSADSATFKIDDVKLSKSSGLALYHHGSDSLLETPGHYDLSPELTASIVKEFAELAASKAEILQLDDERWIVVITESATTAILVFKKKPGQFAIQLLSRIMQDFTGANQDLLEQNPVDSRKLAQPFVAVLKS